MGIAHIFNRISNNVARWQRIKHAVMPHCNTVVNSYSVKFCSITAQLLYLSLDNLSSLMQMSMSWHKLCKRIDNCNDRFAKLFSLHAVSHPQGSCSSHSATFSTHGTSQLIFHILRIFFAIKKPLSLLARKALSILNICFRLGNPYSLHQHRH